MSKVKELVQILEDIELQNSDLDTVASVVAKCKKRLEQVLGSHHPSDDEQVVERLRLAFDHLGKASSLLSDIQRRVKDDPEPNMEPSKPKPPEPKAENPKEEPNSELK